MSDNQKEQLAWVTRVVQIVLLAIATGVGANVYTKVDEIYTIAKMQGVEIDNIKDKYTELRKDNDRQDLEIRAQHQKIELMRTFQNAAQSESQ